MARVAGDALEGVQRVNLVVDLDGHDPAGFADVTLVGRMSVRFMALHTDEILVAAQIARFLVVVGASRLLVADLAAAVVEKFRMDVTACQLRPIVTLGAKTFHGGGAFPDEFGIVRGHGPATGQMAGDAGDLPRRGQRQVFRNFHALRRRPQVMAHAFDPADPVAPGAEGVHVIVHQFLGLPHPRGFQGQQGIGVANLAEEPGRMGIDPHRASDQVDVLLLQVGDIG